ELLENAGISIDKELRVEIAGAIPGLQAQRYNMIGTTLYITPERCEQVLFTDPIFMGADSIGVKESSGFTAQSYEDVVASPDMRLGIVQGSAEVQIAKDSGVAEGQISLLPDVPSAMEALKAGRVDAVAMD